MQRAKYGRIINMSPPIQLRMLKVTTNDGVRVGCQLTWRARDAGQSGVLHQVEFNALRMWCVLTCVTSKFGMTLMTHGLAAETEGSGITVNSLWPATAVESLATKNFGMGDERHARARASEQ